jgi:hypothetical protein
MNAKLMVTILPTQKKVKCMAKSRKTWVRSPSKHANLSDDGKADVTTRAKDIIDIVLKPKHVKPPAKDNRFNYIVDIYSKWHRNYFYFCAKYACPGPNAIAPYFEDKFARLEYVGNNQFNLAYMRHTEKWWELYTELSLVECLKAVRDEPHFFS